jgi:hypothetical protein
VAHSSNGEKNQERKVTNLKRKQGDQLTLITMQTLKNKASKEKQAAAGEGREPGQFQTLAPLVHLSPVFQVVLVNLFLFFLFRVVVSRSDLGC